ncbi:hypothetical protein IFR04_009547 [Cadophora malorum]|uniref:J domain-containing protein n=1 Tax=Cadophora malorum TaxID=108018 RepID=A0A8H7TDR0_9HELO|nr:hypothetical protein IFR04_009547 [Cadophora malorum]
MPRKSKNEDIHEEENEEEEEEELADEPPSIEPYTVLGIEKSATADEIKSAYRKAALKHHPDKAAPHLKDEAHTKFQEVAFAYAVLSDPIRRKRYDTTGSTSESMDADGDFSWSDFYSEQFRDVVTEDAIERFAKAYKNSDEERDDVVKAYEKVKGSWRGIYESVMLGDPLEDEDRFRSYIDAAIASGDVKGFKIYTEESEKDKQKRMKRARLEAEKEAKEAEVESKKIEGKKKAKKDGLGDLAALIQRRQVNAGSSFLDNLEAKYKAQEKEKKPKGKKGKKRVSDEDEDDDDEPSEEAFQAAAKKLKTGKAESEGRKSKRTKH